MGQCRDEAAELQRPTLPDDRLMYEAFVKRDSRFEGVFIVAVRTTGIFCRPTCPAKKAKAENIEFFASTDEAVGRGYRPCRVCRPLEHLGEPPGWMRPLFRALEAEPGRRLKDADIREMALDPARVRRWFQRHHGMSFHSYARSLRISRACTDVKRRGRVIDAAMESGFDSLSGFNAAFRRTTGRAPSESSVAAIVTVTQLLSPLGPLLAGATEEGVCLLEFADNPALEGRMARLAARMGAQFLVGRTPLLDQLEEQVEAYFGGRRRTFDVPLVMPGTPFQRRVWAALLEIPYGATRSYRQQAGVLGVPRGARAVARANGCNTLAILVPCHRVIAADGGVAGYSGGTWRKRYLIDLERAHAGIPAD